MVAKDATGYNRTALPLVGRAEEQCVLRDELRAAINGQGRIVLLGGEAGIGKTSLARGLARESEELGVRVLRGHCYDLASTPPYGPWIDLIASARLSSEEAVPPPALTADSRVRVMDQAALFADVRRFVAELVQSGPILLVLEDLHWADPASVDLLRSLSVALIQWPLLLIVTYRIDELTRHHPFYQQLPALVREANALRLKVDIIDAEALRELVGQHYRLTSVDERRLVTYLDRHSDGNPFFAVELIRALEEAGLLRRGDDRSSLGELDRIVVPSLLRQVIDGRVERLGEATRERLEIAAVIGQEVPLNLWATVAGLDEETLIAIVDRAVAADLLEADHMGTSVRFVHALTREALYTGILPLRRRFWHRRVADVLAARPTADPDTVALHFQRAGDPRAVDWLISAADRAQRVYAWVMAAERLRSAASLVQGVAGQEERYCELVFRAAALGRFADPASGLRALDELYRLAKLADNVVLQAQTSYNRGMHLCYSDRFREGVESLQQSVKALASPALSVQRIYAWNRLYFAHLGVSAVSGDFSEDDLLMEQARSRGFDLRACPNPWLMASAGPCDVAVDLADEFIANLDDFPNPSTWFKAMFAFAIHGSGISAAALGRPDAARHAWERSRKLFSAADHFALIAFTQLGELRDVALTYGAADPAYRRRLAEDAAVTLARMRGALPSGVSPRLAWLGCLVLDGGWADADQILGDLPTPGNCFLRREVTAATALLGRYRGEPERAWVQIHSLLRDGAATEPGDIIHQEGLFLIRLAADLCLDSGDLSGAMSWLEAHDRWLAWSKSELGRADGLVSWARWQLMAGDAIRAKMIANEVLVTASSPPQPLVQLAANRLLGECTIVTGDYQAAREHLAVAQSLAESCEAPYERELTLLAMAELEVATGSTDEAGLLLDQVSEVGTRLGATQVLRRVETLRGQIAPKNVAEAYPAGLTQREVDVLRLVAQHKTDREIAGELFVSPRTVQTHVANILSKLQVENRRAARVEAVRLTIV